MPLRYLGWTCLAAVIGAVLALAAGTRARDDAPN